VPGVQLDRVDTRAVNRVLAGSGEVRAYMQRRLAAGKAFAESISPDAPPVGSGYRASWITEMGVFPDGVPVGRLVNTDPLWAVIEKGSSSARPQGGSSPAHHVFERTLLFWQRG
jgi:hypothetical protein